MGKRITAVFLPYKASMWDSLESVYLAAKKDPDCDALVIPIPYYDRDKDGHIVCEHYEGDLFPKDVPITDYRTYDIGREHPDAVFIHNPYDDGNLVTTVHPDYYSRILKEQTDLLVYIPYYATSGGMSIDQKYLPAYEHADLIVTQSEQYRAFFDEKIPEDRFLPLGSPKFDSVIGKCKNPPPLPEAWKDRILGRKVYFYNTSIGGMLDDTGAFLAKMQYVFLIFSRHPEVCLIWRPHPLLASTMESQRPLYKPVFDKLKEIFVTNGIGILDETQSIEDTIALSDVYIGDAGTSVTSLFGVSGKPVFILDNHIHGAPGPDSFRGIAITGALLPDRDYRYLVSANNQLWQLSGSDRKYHFVCDLCEYTGGAYYLLAKEMGGKVYIAPGNAQDIGVWDGSSLRHIPLERKLEQAGAFYGARFTDRYLFLFPFHYPYLVRFEFKTEEITYIQGIREFAVDESGSEVKTGGVTYRDGEFYISSPRENKVMTLNEEYPNPMITKIPLTGSGETGGFVAAVPHDGEWWLLPYEGYDVTVYNRNTGSSRVYSAFPAGITCLRWPGNNECAKRPFGNVVFGGDRAILSPLWANMYVSLDPVTGEADRWIPPHEEKMRDETGYCISGGMGGFLASSGDDPRKMLFFTPERRLYEVNLETGESGETELVFDPEELYAHAPGFSKDAEWQRYCLNEDAFCTLEDLITGDTPGKPFDREKELRSYSDINASPEGDCGEKVFTRVKTLLGDLST